MSTLSVNSSDSSHSASDFDNHSLYISNSTLSSTPSSPSVKSSTLRPKHIVLPSAVFASAVFLHDLAVTLDKGAGDLVVLCLGYWNNGENAEENTKPPMQFATLAKEAALGIENSGMEWRVIMVTIDGTLLAYLVLFAHLLTLYCVGKEVPYFVSEKGGEFESHSITVDDDKRVSKSIDGVLADYKSEFEDQPQSIVSCSSLSSLFFDFICSRQHTTAYTRRTSSSFLVRVVSLHNRHRNPGSQILYSRTTCIFFPSSHFLSYDSHSDHHF